MKFTDVSTERVFQTDPIQRFSIGTSISIQYTEGDVLVGGKSTPGDGLHGPVGGDCDGEKVVTEGVKM